MDAWGSTGHVIRLLRSGLTEPCHHVIEKGLTSDLLVVWGSSRCDRGGRRMRSVVDGDRSSRRIHSSRSGLGREHGQEVPSVYLSWRSLWLSRRHRVWGGRERRRSGRGVSRDDRRVGDGWRGQLGQQRLHGISLAGLLRLLTGDLRRSRRPFGPYRRRRRRHSSTRRRLAQEPGKQGVQRLAPIVLLGFSRCGRDVGGDRRISELDLYLARRRRSVSPDLRIDGNRFGSGRYGSVSLGLFVQVGCRFPLSHVWVRGLLAMQLDPLFQRATRMAIRGNSVSQPSV